ncbi:Addiction module toxin, RelE/StbE family [Sterolibacterium denitrificans]|uniref:Addiction module toxin, RelE/StbE family n=2 Tax=Sterolibacterium denitrificans TaxID=157592 RepID=A0A7Z7HSK0_9PROT|nr:type II toxin-antitoxin system YafQ family toxin [Sterolibacterium denitrificans]KYC29284.1 hypothetical protein ACY05_01735 [Sterolibacterium denitrificans]SMB30422.1 Addiction module toxin, RelE/StbE family [Sterolibacterium denitrificans]
MRMIEWTSRFKKDYKRESKGQHRGTLDASLELVVQALADDQALQPSQRDHDLTGDWAGCRECHLKPDLLLIYRKIDTEEHGILRLARLGSHSELFG